MVSRVGGGCGCAEEMAMVVEVLSWSRSRSLSESLVAVEGMILVIIIQYD